MKSICFFVYSFPSFAGSNIHYSFSVKLVGFALNRFRMGGWGGGGGGGGGGLST